jgi:hypothetical protein
MKTILLLSAFCYCMMFSHVYAQKKAEENQRSSRHNFNIGLGLGYYGYIGNSLPVVMINYEFDVAHNITVAPFIGYYSYSSSYYWGNKNYPFRFYSYRETVIPLGAKGAYYFDEILRANSKWDFYGAASIGFNIRTISWESGYSGDAGAIRGAGPLYLDIHVGGRYYFNDRFGMFLDLSSGVSTIGVSF